MPRYECIIRATDAVPTMILFSYVEPLTCANVKLCLRRTASSDQHDSISFAWTATGYGEGRLDTARNIANHWLHLLPKP